MAGTEKVLGFTIEVRGTDAERSKLGDLNREIITTTEELKKYKTATEGNVGAQLASAEKTALLETKLKALKGEYNSTKTAIIDHAKQTKTVAGSYDNLVARNKELSATLRSLPNGFDKTSVEVAKMKKEMFDNTAQLKQFDAEINRHFRSVGDYPTTVSLAGKSMAELRDIVKEYAAAAAMAAENPPLQAKFLEIAAEAKAELKDTKELIAALDPDNRTAGAFAKLGGTIVGAFGAAQGAAALFGVENENVMKSLQKLQATQAVLSGLKELGDAQDNINIAKKVFLIKLQNAETAKGIVVTEGATVAQRLWNLAVASSPWFILITVLAAVALAVGAYISQTGVAAEAENVRSRAIDGTIIKNKELREEYNNHALALKEIENAYKVLNGTMTEFEAQVANIHDKYKASISDINNETEAQLIETGGLWNELWLSVGGVGARISEAQDKQMIVLEGQEKVNAELLKQDTELKQAQLAQDVKLENDRQKTLETLGKSELQIKIDNINKETLAKLTNTKFTAEEQQAITRDANEKIAALRQGDVKKFSDDQEARTQKLREEEEKRLKIIEENTAKIIALNNQLIEGYIRLNNEGIEEQLSLLRFQTNVQKEELRKQIVNKTDATEQELKINELLNERILQLDALREDEEAKIIAEGEEKKLKQMLQSIDTEEQIAVLRAQRDIENEKERNKAILQIRIESDQKKLALLQASGDADSEEVKLQIEKLKTEIDQLGDALAAGDADNRSLLAKLFGVDNDSAKLIADKAMEIAKQVSDAIFNAQRERLDRAKEAELEHAANLAETQEQMLQAQLNNQIISQQQYDQLKTNLDRAAEERKKEIEKKAFEDRKKIALKQIAIDLAQEIIKIQVNAAANPANAVTFGGAGIAQAGILTAAAVASAGIQAAVIAAQKFSKGGQVKGPGTGTSDSILAWVSNGEGVMTARTMELFGPLLSELNHMGGGKRFAAGGIPLPVGSTPSLQSVLGGGITMEQAVNLILNGVNAQEVFLPVDNISSGLRQAALIEQDRKF